MDKIVNVTKGNSVWENFLHWYKGFSDAKAAKYRRKNRESLEKLQNELGIIKQ